MPKIAYKKHRFNKKTRTTVEQAKSIINEMSAMGYTLTIRQLYYQFVSRNWLENNERSYKRLITIMTNARENGEVDWLAIEDRGRGAMLHRQVATPEKVLAGIEMGLTLNPWLDQETYLEVWVEKSALEGVIARSSSRWRAPYMACKGNLSASEAWRAGQRFERAIADGRRPVLLHLGDHDPSGLDMTRDNEKRLSMFARAGVDVQRLALNMDQIEEHKPPPNPVKPSSLTPAYTAQHGPVSWELDALPPAVIDRLISDSIETYVDKDVWEKTLKREAEKREPLRRLGIRWAEARELVMSGQLPLKQLEAMLDATAGAPEVIRGAANRLRSIQPDNDETRAKYVDHVKGLPMPMSYKPKSKDGPDEGFKAGISHVAEVLEGVELNAPLGTAEAADELSALAHSLDLARDDAPTFEEPEDYEPAKPVLPWKAYEDEEGDPDGYDAEEEQ